MKLNFDFSAILLNDLEELIKNVNATLTTYGVNEKITTLSDLQNLLDRLRVLKPKDEYLGVTLDSDGFIVEINPLHDFVVKQDVPEDVLRGYYKIQNGVIYLDKERQALLWRNE